MSKSHVFIAKVHLIRVLNYSYKNTQDIYIYIEQADTYTYVVDIHIYKYITFKKLIHVNVYSIAPPAYLR